MQKKTIIELSKDCTLVMKINMFDEDEEIDLDHLLRIDIQNLAIEICTFPIVMNKVGLLLADANYNVNLSKLSVETTEAELAEKFRNDYQQEHDGKQMSNEKVNEAISRDPKYLLKKKIYFNRMKEQEYLNSLYWSMRSKDQKIDKLSMTIQAGDVNETIINNKLKRFNYIDLKVLQNKNQ